MTEYIRRNDAVKIAERYGLANGSVLGRHTGLADCIASEISALPAADVAPVVHGRWIKYPRARYFKCSECKCIVPYKKAMIMDGERKYKYCPNCGAKMDECNESEN